MILSRFENFLIFVSAFVGEAPRAVSRSRYPVEGAQQLVYRLRPHAGIELVAVLLDLLEIHVVGEKFAAFQIGVIGHPGIDDHEGLEIEDPLDLAQGHVEQEPHSRGQGLQVPDVGDRARELDVAHAFPAHLGDRHLHSALLADHSAMLETLVLPAQALVVLVRSEDLRAEEPSRSGLKVR